MNALDLQLVQWFHDHRMPALTILMQLVSDLNGYLAMSIWAALFAGYLLWKHRRDWALVAAVAVPGIMVLNALVKNLVHRPRPDIGDALQHLATDSFPSGHASVSAVFYGLVAAYVIANTSSRPSRIAAVTIAIVMIALVGTSRVYLGVHYPTDVVGAFVEGIAWLAICLAVIRPSRLRKEGELPVS